MPHSWIRVPNGASPAVRVCMEERGDTSRNGFDYCVRAIIEGYPGCSVESIYYETNGRWAHVLFEWVNESQRTQIIHVVQGEGQIDLHTREAINKLEMDLES